MTDARLLSADDLAAIQKRRDRVLTGEPSGRRRREMGELIMDDVPVLLGHIAALEAERTQLRGLLGEFLDEQGEALCRLDHHGFCQEHMSYPPCLVAEARKALREEG